MSRFSLAIWLMLALCIQCEAAQPPTYGAPNVFMTGISNAYFLAPGDFDRDGDRDIAIAMDEQGKVAWCENMHTKPPSFTLHVLASGITQSLDVDVGDMSNDGWQDIVSTSQSKILLFRNLKTNPATFEMDTVDANATGSWTSYLCDMNNDGTSDILTCNMAGNSVVCYTNNRETPIPTFTKTVLVTGLSQPYMVRAADFDHDQRKDLLVSNYGGAKNLIWFRNNGNGTFTAHDLGKQGWTMEVADMDKDGWTDIIATSLDNTTVTFYRNTGASGTMGFEPKVIVPDIYSAYGLYILDYDNDHDKDVLIASSSSHILAWVENKLWNEWAPYPMDLGYEWRSWNACPVDFDGDGDLDLFCLSSTKIYGLENLSGPPRFNNVRNWMYFQ